MLVIEMVPESEGSSTTDRRGRGGAHLPRAVLLGFGILLVGLVVDVVAHVLYPASEKTAVLGHLITLAGMLVALAGAIALAFRRSTESSRPKLEEGGSRARSDLVVR